jgi:hypothetical protein
MTDMQDHYSYVDDRLSVYNYLRYSPQVWRLLNSDVHWQNRLRHSQYIELFERAGYSVVYDEPQLPSEEDLPVLAGLPLAPEFRNFTLSDLGTRASHTIIQPRP